MQRLLQILPGAVAPGVIDLDRRELAVEVRNLLLPALPGIALEFARRADCLFPVLFLLVDVQQVLQRGAPVWPLRQPLERLLGAVKQPRLQVVLAEFVECHDTLLLREVGPLEQILVHPDRSLGLAAPPEQAAECEMQLDGLRVDPDDLGERLDRLVGLLVQQEVEPGEVGARDPARFGDELLDVDAGGKPPEPEEHGKCDQPPELEFGHVGQALVPLHPGRRVSG